MSAEDGVDCEGCGLPGAELEYLPDEESFYCPACGHRTSADLLPVDDGDRACRVCGCTDRHGCPQGCWWVEADLCSACAEAANEPTP